jgi:pyridoxine/pyridoxamine 5'-phosphate oxidase
MSEPRTSRPGFPGYGITTDADGALPWSWATERLASAHNYWIATGSADRGPNTMPVWGLWRDGAFVFSTGATSRKARNLAADPRIVVHLESGDEVVLLEGVVEAIEATIEIVDEYEAKYAFRPEVGADGWYRVSPQRAYAWREYDYPQSATRFDFD